MFHSTTLLAVVAAFSAFTSAQNYSTTGPLSVDPNSIPSSLRQTWCRAQTTSCPQICGGRAQPNTCDPNTLEFTCTCSNGNTPNITDFDQTIPAFVCAQWKDNCVKAHPNDLDGQTDCLSVTCGEKNASSNLQPTSSSSSAMPSATSASSRTPSSASQTTSNSGSAASATGTSAAVAMYVGQNYGTGIVLAGMLALFGAAL